MDDNNYVTQLRVLNIIEGLVKHPDCTDYVEFFYDNMDFIKDLEQSVKALVMNKSIHLQKEIKMRMAKLRAKDRASEANVEVLETVGEEPIEDDIFAAQPPIPQAQPAQKNQPAPALDDIFNQPPIPQPVGMQPPQTSSNLHPTNSDLIANLLNVSPPKARPTTSDISDDIFSHLENPSPQQPVKKEKVLDFDAFSAFDTVAKK